MTKEEAKIILSKTYAPFCYGKNVYNVITCDMIDLYHYITTNEGYTFSGKDKNIISEYKKVFNARVTLGEGFKLF